jgi:AcrR family transcriptional regulator
MSATKKIAIAPSKPPRNGLREDARKNRQKILKIARSLYTDQGPDVPHDVIAQKAGVGVATLFRHFPSRQHILEALVEERFSDFHTLVETSMKVADPWAGIEAFVRGVVAIMAEDRAILSAVWASASITPPAIDSGLVQGVAALVERAQLAGQLRNDISPADLMVLTMRPPLPRRGPGNPFPEIDQLFIDVLLRGIRAA